MKHFKIGFATLAALAVAGGLAYTFTPGPPKADAQSSAAEKRARIEKLFDEKPGVAFATLNALLLEINEELATRSSNLNARQLAVQRLDEAALREEYTKARRDLRRIFSLPEGDALIVEIETRIEGLTYNTPEN